MPVIKPQTGVRQGLRGGGGGNGLRLRTPLPLGPVHRSQAGHDEQVRTKHLPSPEPTGGLGPSDTGHLQVSP